MPAEVRRRLGLAPGAVLEWNDEDGVIMVRRMGRYTSEDISRAVFPEGITRPRCIGELREGIRRHIRDRHARH